MKTLRALIAAGLVVATFGIAVAKLPPPPPMDRRAEGGRRGEEGEGRRRGRSRQGRAGEGRGSRRGTLFRRQKAKGKQVPAAQMPPAAPAAESKAVSAKPEKQGAHSPPETKR